ncbi:hypothetical protein L207DRAFT_563707 [Hyaloscypha variabilis F]|uniref:Uncharacterized protein n=1 Tax=Hyaloscypha variabilis (strain UAMH 11265 / GT02V1 / F) TaxID=1149755 RepID=A0A2J6RWI8_HYAVF|nr:hypothetical protein L207DRAFT_563707 [Hyaloscypha variabilis F]
MSFGFGPGDVLSIIHIGTRIYKYGFSKAARAHMLYNEFGDNVQALTTNLEDLHKIVGYLGGNGPNGGRFLDASYMSSLVDIIGDYRRTLQDCDQFLKDKERFSWEGDFVNNIIWNFSIASEVQTLKDRVAFLNIKLMTVLKTLDLRMANQLHINIFRIHQDLALRIDSAQDDIIHAVQAAGDDILEYLRSKNGDPSIASNPRYSSNAIIVPYALQNLFEIQLRGSSFDADQDQFPLVLGLDAAIYHIYTADSITADSKDMKRERQWLAIYKAHWMISKVKSGREYKDACSMRATNNFERQMNEIGITVASYVKRFEIELSGLVRSSGLNSAIPDEGVIIQLFSETPEMWLPPVQQTRPTPTWELEYSENIMDVALCGPYRDFDQSLHLFKLTDVDFKLVITDTPKPPPGNSHVALQKTNNIMNVDIRRSRFIPLYAASTSPNHGPLNITFQGDHLASGSSALVFKKRTELFKFQHAITGHQVVHESLGIKVVTYAASRIIGGNQVEYSGRLQLWRAKKPQNSTTKETGSSTMTSNSSTSASSTNTILPAELSGSPYTSPLPPNVPSFPQEFNDRDSIYSFPSNRSPYSPEDIGNRDSASSLPSPHSPRSSQQISNRESISSLRPPFSTQRIPGNRDSVFSLSPTNPSPRRPSPRSSTLMSPIEPQYCDSTAATDFSSLSIRSKRRDSTWSTASATTSATANTAISLATACSYTTATVSPDGTMGLILDPPRPSLLVLLLQKISRHGEVAFSTLAVELDENTVISKSSCKCRKDPNSCLRVVIQRASGPLTSVRQDAGSVLDHWNLAAFGPAQRKTLEKESGEKERLAWVAIDFPRIEEKLAFLKGFENVRLLLRKERAAYNWTMQTLRN